MRFVTTRYLLHAMALAAAFAPGPARAQVFYEIVSGDGARDWLLGTVHAEDPRLLDFPPVLIQALRQVDVVALELAPDRLALERLQQKSQLPAGSSLADRIPAPLYRRARDALVAEGVAAERAERMRPWAAAMVLARPPGATGGFMDSMLAGLAERLGARVEALETVDEQVAFFSGLGREAQIALLEDALERMDRRQSDLEEIVSAYLDGDLNRLDSLARTALATAPEGVAERFRSEGLRARNARMVDRALPVLAADAVLIAVGALHLPGERGIVALLRQQGYRVEPIY